MKYRRWTAAMILLALCLTLCGAAAGEEGRVQLREIWSESGWIDAEAMGVSPDTRYPVYAAPFEDAWRPENGQAELIAAEYFNVLARAGEWRMVEYRVSDTAKRIGWVKIPYEVLQEISRRITNEVKGVGRVVYDITSKPPGTVEWE